MISHPGNPLYDSCAASGSGSGTAQPIIDTSACPGSLTTGVNGDTITIDAVKNELTLAIPAKEFAARKKAKKQASSAARFRSNRFCSI